MPGTGSYATFSHHANFIYDQSHPKRGRWVKRIAVLVSTLFILSALSFGSTSDLEVMNNQQDLYCEMVGLHKTDSTLGWPDFKGIYSQQCLGE